MLHEAWLNMSPAMVEFAFQYSGLHAMTYSGTPENEIARINP